MSDLKSISIRFLKKSKVLTLSCFLSVLIATVLIIELFNLSTSASKSYGNSVDAMYGECDAEIHYADYKGISDDVLTEIARIKKVSSYATLMYSDEVRIADKPIYAIGTDNSTMVRSRYHYTKELSQNEIAISETLAKGGSYKVGDYIEINNVNLEIAEVFDDHEFISSSLEMIVVCKEVLQNITDKDYSTNVILFESDDVRNAEYEIKRVDRDITTVVFEGNDMYIGVVDAFQFFIIVVSLCIVLVTSLFTLSVFRNFIYKYRHDLAMLRLIGGTSSQTKKIFKYMIRSILLVGVSSGYIISYLFNELVINKWNSKLHIIAGKCSFSALPSLGIASAIFVVIYIIMTYIISKSGDILPIEVLRSNEVSKRKGRRTKNIRILKSDLFIARKMVKVRVKDNTIMLLTIAMLVAISIIGASFSSIIKNNNEEHLKNQYLTETVLTTSSSITINDSDTLYNELKEDENIEVSSVYIVGYRGKYNGKEVDYSIADINAMVKQNLLPIEEFSESSLLVSESFAAANNIQLNDSIEINTPIIYKRDSNGIKIGVEKEEKTCVMQIACIMKDDALGYYDVYIDIHNNDFFREEAWLSKIYIDGDSQYIEDKLESLRGRYSYIKWDNYNEALQISEREISNRYVMIEMIVKVLVMISTIGWINSLRNIFVSRIKDYDILRLQGVSRIRLVKMIVYQIFYYLLSGAILGVAIGCLAVEALMYSEIKRFLFTFNFSIVYQMMIIMLLFCLLLVPLIRKICNKRLLVEDM